MWAQVRVHRTRVQGAPPRISGACPCPLVPLSQPRQQVSQTLQLYISQGPWAGQVREKGREMGYCCGVHREQGSNWERGLW